MMPSVSSISKRSWCDCKKEYLSFFSFRVFFSIVVTELSALKNLINEMFLKFENELVAKELVSSREGSLNKTLSLTHFSPVSHFYIPIYIRGYRNVALD